MESLADAARRLLEAMDARKGRKNTVPGSREWPGEIKESGKPQPLVEPGERRPRTGSTTQVRRRESVAPAKWLRGANDNRRVHAVSFALEGTR